MMGNLAEFSIILIHSMIGLSDSSCYQSQRLKNCENLNPYPCYFDNLNCWWVRKKITSGLLEPYLLIIIPIGNTWNFEIAFSVSFEQSVHHSNKILWISICYKNLEIWRGFASILLMFPPSILILQSQRTIISEDQR